MEQDEEAEVGGGQPWSWPGSFRWKPWIYPKSKITPAMVQKWIRGSPNWKDELIYEITILQERNYDGLCKGHGNGEVGGTFFIY